MELARTEFWEPDDVLAEATVLDLEAAIARLAQCESAIDIDAEARQISRDEVKDLPQRRSDAVPALHAMVTCVRRR